MKIKREIIQKIEELFHVNELVNRQMRNKMRDDGFSYIDSHKETDIFLASYPKSGVTWLQNLITCMLLNSTSDNITPKLVNELIPDIHFKKYYKRIFPRMFFKTHNLPRPEYKKVIHLVRDGRDSLVSFYHYQKLNKESGPSYKEMVEMPEKIWSVKWYEHTSAWNKNPYNAEILSVRYEDLLNEPIKTLKTLADFSEIDITDENLQKIYEVNSIKTLRDKVEKLGWDYDKNFGVDSKNFFRKGTIGEYKNELSQELIHKFEEGAREMLLKYGYEV